jgi:hypothetical protein
MLCAQADYIYPAMWVEGIYIYRESRQAAQIGLCGNVDQAALMMRYN